MMHGHTYIKSAINSASFNTFSKPPLIAPLDNNNTTTI